MSYQALFWAIGALALVLGLALEQDPPPPSCVPMELDLEDLPPEAIDAPRELPPTVRI